MKKRFTLSLIFVLFVFSESCGGGGGMGAAGSSGASSVQGTSITIGLPGVGGQSLAGQSLLQGQASVIPAKLSINFTSSNFTLANLQSLNPGISFPVLISPVSSTGTTLTLNVPVVSNLTISVQGLTTGNLLIFSGSSTVDVNALLASSSNSSVSVSISISKVNQPPTVSAGVDQTVVSGNSVSLSGSASDPNGDAVVSYSWTLITLPSASNAALSDTNASTSFVTDLAGIYVARLSAVDSVGATGFDDIQITATAGTLPAPVLSGITPTSGQSAGGEIITVSGSNFVSGAGLNVKFGLSSSSSVTFVSASQLSAQTVPGLRGSTVYITVLNPDGQSDSSPSTIFFTYTNTPPNAIVNISPASTISSGSSASFLLTSSSDSDGDSLTGSWTLDAKPVGSASTLSSTVGLSVGLTTDTVGNYTVTGTVSDGMGGTAAQTVVLTATSGTVANMLPTVTVSTSTTTPLVGTPVTLDASGATDPDSGPSPLSFFWSYGVAPTNPPFLPSASDSIVTFTPDTSSMSYQVNLSVSDGAGSQPFSISISAMYNAPIMTLMTPDSGPEIGGNLVTINGIFMSGTPAISSEAFVDTGGGMFMASISAQGSSFVTISPMPAGPTGGGTATIIIRNTDAGAKSDSMAYFYTFASSSFLDTTADTVLGQPNFTLSNFTASAIGMNTPSGVYVDAQGRVFVADANNNRVLIFDDPVSGDSVADTVLGQFNFVSSGFATSSTAMATPTGVYVDAQGRVFVADKTNNRVLIFDDPVSGDTVADTVLGPPNFDTSAPSALSGPSGVYVDVQGRLFVADALNNRVLIFDNPVSGDTIADTVLGQPNFISALATTSATGMNTPVGVYVDTQSRLFVVDEFNNRVLIFDNPVSGDTIADTVLGQPNFTSSAAATSTTGMNGPRGIYVDIQGGVVVADAGNNRVLIFNDPVSGDIIADTVLGQANFTSAVLATSATGMSSPRGVYVDAQGRIFIAEESNHRVLIFNKPF